MTSLPQLICTLQPVQISLRGFYSHFDEYMYPDDKRIDIDFVPVNKLFHPYLDVWRETLLFISKHPQRIPIDYKFVGDFSEELKYSIGMCVHLANQYGILSSEMAETHKEVTNIRIRDIF